MKHIKMLILMATLGAGILLPSCHKEEPVDPVVPTENEKRPSGSYGIFMEDAPDQSPFASRTIAPRVEYPGGVVTGGGWFADRDKSTVRAVPKPGYLIKKMVAREGDDPQRYVGTEGNNYTFTVTIWQHDVWVKTEFVMRADVSFNIHSDSRDMHMVVTSRDGKPILPFLKELRGCTAMLNGSRHDFTQADFEKVSATAKEYNFRVPGGAGSQPGIGGISERGLILFFRDGTNFNSVAGSTQHTHFTADMGYKINLE